MRAKILTSVLLVINLVTFGQVEKNSKDRSRFGVKGGLNVSDLKTSSYNYNSKFGFSLGGVYNLASGKKLTLPIEIIYSKNVTSDNFADYDFSLISINNMANYYLNKNFFLEAGLPMSVFLNSTITLKSTNQRSDNETLGGVDVALALGVGHEFTNKIVVNLRYSYGFIPVFDDEHLSVLSLSLGYSF